MPLLANYVLVADDIILMQSFSSRRFANLLLSSVIKMIQARAVKFFGKSLRNFVPYMTYELRVECFFKGGEGVEDI